MNPYLLRKREQYEAIKATIEGLQTRASDEDRDLTETELRSVQEQGEAAKALASEIESLTEIETRNRKVGELAVTGADGDQDKTRGKALGFAAKDRDPGHYRKGSGNSFFGDMFRAKTYGDDEANDRLREHNRALDTTNEGPGIVVPVWLTEEFEMLPQQGRALANVVRNMPILGKPSPITLPGQTASAAAEVTEQASENTAVEDDDAWDSAAVVVTPKPIAGSQIVSRQMLDMSTPSVDLLIYGDLLAAYNAVIETKIGTALLAVGTALTATETQFGDLSTDDTNGPDLVVRAALAVRKALYSPANVLAMTADRYGEFLKLKDAAGRPLIPDDSAGPMNVFGVGSVAVDGRIKGLGAVISDGMDDPTANEDTFTAFRADQVLLWESPAMRFRYEEPAGPESIKLGIWKYAALAVRQGTRAVKNVTITTNA